MTSLSHKKGVVPIAIGRLINMSNTFLEADLYFKGSFPVATTWSAAACAAAGSGRGED